jgi:hypothetical protein
MRPILFAIEPRIVLGSVGLKVHMNRLCSVNGLLKMAVFCLGLQQWDEEPKPDPKIPMSATLRN